MGKTRIEYVTDVWNPITGCTPVSGGCDHCYARRMANRLKGRFGYHADEPFKVTMHPDRLDQPLRWRNPRRIFVCSMGDLFHEDVPEIEILKIFAVMADTPQHTYLVLTKRPTRMKNILTNPTVANDVWLMTSVGLDDSRPLYPLPNVWLGVTAENQARADERIPILLEIPAAVRFVSIEPMLGDINLIRACDVAIQINGDIEVPAVVGIEKWIHWCIVGGETGPRARPVHPDWVRSLRDQCQATGVSFFFKSWGVGKKKAGRLLDGRTWDEYPRMEVSK